MDFLRFLIEFIKCLIACTKIYIMKKNLYYIFNPLSLFNEKVIEYTSFAQNHVNWMKLAHLFFIFLL